MFHPHRRRVPVIPRGKRRSIPFPVARGASSTAISRGKRRRGGQGNVLFFLERKNGINQQEYEGFNRETIYKSGYMVDFL
jgi:hypothetical protein